MYDMLSNIYVNDGGDNISHTVWANVCGKANYYVLYIVQVCAVHVYRCIVSF